MSQEQPEDPVGQRSCSNCGETLDEGARFCAHCGAAAGAQSSPRSSAGVVVPRTDHIKYRNMVAQVILAIVTFGIYTIYWYYVTLEELHLANGKPKSAGLWTLLSVIPIAQYFAQWHHAFEYSEFVGDKYPSIDIFILWIVFSPAVWFLVQSDLNRAATAPR